MCLGVPGKVLEIRRTDVPSLGTVDFGGVQREIALDWVPEVREGDYVLVHVGFAIGVIDEAEARETLRLLAELGEAGRAEAAALGHAPPPPGAPA
ncbi:MAG: HypC/HybG/HupF family hydrogenase formation chaperone [Candidatus Krumholzibacteriia bacterium]